MRFVQTIGKYNYFRRAKHKRIALPGEIGSPEFKAAYERAIDGKGELAKRVGFMPGSLAWAIDRYTAHEEFNSKAAGTRAAYLVMLKMLRASPIAQALVRDLNRQHVNAHCAEIAQRCGKSRGDYQAMLISIVWDFADRHLAQCKLSDRSNPTRKRKRSYDAQPRLAWPQRRFVEGASDELKLAFALLLYTGQRRGDVVRMRWTDVDGKFISVVQEKTGEHVHVRVHRDLRKMLMSTERRSDFILTTRAGKPIGRTVLTKLIKRRLRAIGGEKYTLHGLRKAAGVKLAEAGASVPIKRIPHLGAACCAAGFLAGGCPLWVNRYRSTRPRYARDVRFTFNSVRTFARRRNDATWSSARSENRPAFGL
jgi:integrase